MQFRRRPIHSCLAILLSVFCLPLIATGGEPRGQARPNGLNTFTVDIFVPAVPRPAADDCEFTLTSGVKAPACGECGQKCRCAAAECPACASRAAVAQPSRPLENDCRAAQEILELREALGGSVLEGTEFHDASSAAAPSAVIDFRSGNRCEFGEADSAAVVRQIRYLDMQQSQDEADENCSENPSRSSTYTPAIAIEGIPGRRYPDDYTGHLMPAPRSADHGQRIQALREAGRCLDQAAERLEEIELYDRADQLRGQAQVLRREARGH